MMWNVLSSTKYNLSNANTKSSSELVSLIPESLPFDDNGQCSSIPIINHQEVLLNEQDKPETTNSQVCRICYSTGDLRSLISPCLCSGTMGILHRDCLERWLEISNTTKCEICQHEFEVTRYPKSLFYFLRNPLHSSDIRYLVNDVLLFIFLTIIIIWLIIISVAKIQMTKNFIDAISYLVLPFSVFCIYIVWCWVTARYHVQVIREWRSVNQLVRVISRRENQLVVRSESNINPSSILDCEQQQSLLYTDYSDSSPTLIVQSQENFLPEIHVVA